VKVVVAVKVFFLVKVTGSVSVVVWTRVVGTTSVSRMVVGTTSVSRIVVGSTSV
jgi:hypothetical protein